MIEAQINVPGGVHSIAEINVWLKENVGFRAPDRDWVTDSLPWASDWLFGHYEYYFARAHDATMFALRWGL